MVKRFRSKRRITRKMRRGGDSTSSSRKRSASESRIFSRPASKSRSRSRSSSSKKSKSKSKSSSAEEYINDTCPICLDLLSIRPTIMTTCRPHPHTFHEDCLIGWCGAQRGNKTCPVCRGEIKGTCDAIGPFNSMEIFRYIEDRWSPQRAANNQTASLLIDNPKFNPNISASYHDSLGQVSLFWHLARDGNLDLLKKLLARPDLVIPASDAADYAGDNRIRKLIIQYKKVPPRLKKLWM